MLRVGEKWKKKKKNQENFARNRQKMKPHGSSVGLRASVFLLNFAERLKKPRNLARLLGH